MGFLIGWYNKYMINVLNLKRKLFVRLAVLVFLVFLLNTAGSLFGWYELAFWYDDVMHFLGGIWLGLLVFWVFFNYEVRKNKLKKIHHAVLPFIVLVVMGALFWEGLEFGTQALWNNPGLLAEKADSIRDILWGTLGGFIGIIVNFARLRHHDR
jgi:branched-subunit amino acid transport protein